MGTRSLTHVIDEDKEILCLYRQFDGYPEGHGAELAKFLKGKRLINGICGQTLDEAWNGAGCMAAALVASLKDRIGNVYVYPPGSTDCGEEYTYTLRVKDLTLTIECDRGFNGTVEEFAAWCASQGGAPISQEEDGDGHVC